MEDRAHLKRGSHMGSFGGGGGGGGPAQPNQHPTTHNQDSVSPASHQTDLDNAPTPPFKRPRIDACRKASYPRQRALNACLNCRTRKTKCDNLRPTCSSCARINAECVFADERKDHSSFDLASLAIIERVNHAVQLLEAQRQDLQQIISSSSITISSTEHPFHSVTGICPLTPAGNTQDQAVGSQPVHQDPGSSKDSPDPAGSQYCSIGDVPDWPIFGVTANCRAMEELIFNARVSSTCDPRSHNRKGRGVREEDVLHLMQKFLVQVHTKNPVLNVMELHDMARDVTENGFSWDAQSCLILYACALGSISEKFSAHQTYDENGLASGTPNSLSSAEQYATAEAYYTAARKRLGLLDCSLLSIQCYFFAGVYEMYTLRPLKAWMSFHNACVNFQTHMKAKSRYKTGHNISEDDMERRLYWSCFKSECELREELDVPASGLGKLNYPDGFPLPPAKEASLRESEASSPNQSQVLNAYHKEFEGAWYYYLAELAYRQISNRLTQSFYQTGSHSWLTRSLESMVLVAAEFETQLRTWSDHVQAGLTLDSGQVRSDELSMMIHVRFVEFQERLYRPFLYVSIHGHYDETTINDYAHLVQQSLNACCAVISTLWSRYQYRHHGTWFGMRRLFLSAMVLLAAIKSNKVAIAPEYESAIRMAVEGLKYWEDESPDIEEARKILESVMQSVNVPVVGV